jgi:hypothetical protein
MPGETPDRGKWFLVLYLIEVALDVSTWINNL